MLGRPRGVGHPCNSGAVLGWPWRGAVELSLYLPRRPLLSTPLSHLQILTQPPKHAKFSTRRDVSCKTPHALTTRGVLTLQTFRPPWFHQFWHGLFMILNISVFLTFGTYVFVFGPLPASIDPTRPPCSFSLLPIRKYSSQSLRWWYNELVVVGGAYFRVVLFSILKPGFYYNNPEMTKIRTEKFRKGICFTRDRVYSKK